MNDNKRLEKCMVKNYKSGGNYFHEIKCSD